MWLVFISPIIQKKENKSPNLKGELQAGIYLDTLFVAAIGVGVAHFEEPFPPQLNHAIQYGLIGKGEEC